MTQLISFLGYINEHDVELDSCYNYMALEATIRAIEDDPEFPPYHPTKLTDIRQYGHLESVNRLRELIRKPEFSLDLINIPALVQGGYVFKTLYGREAKRGFMDNRQVIQTSKGRLVLDEYVTITYHPDPGP